MRILLLFLLPALLLGVCGCLGVQGEADIPSFRLADDGSLTLFLPDPEAVTRTLQTRGNVTVEEITFLTFAGNVSAVLISPPDPAAALVWAPGAGVPAHGHIEHLLAYGESWYAVLVVDIRGNGGKTPGHPLDMEADYTTLLSGGWPQVYLIAADLIMGERYLHDRFGTVPVWVVGESNGGRYAAQAAAADPHFSGYVGISTSGFSLRGEEYTGQARRFLLSVDPQALAGHIAPRPALLFHSPRDPVIPLAAGEELADAFGEDGEWFLFNGTHGVDGEVDRLLLIELNSR